MAKYQIVRSTYRSAEMWYAQTRWLKNPVSNTVSFKSADDAVELLKKELIDKKTRGVVKEVEIR